MSYDEARHIVENMDEYTSLNEDQIRGLYILFGVAVESQKYKDLVGQLAIDQVLSDMKLLLPKLAGKYILQFEAIINTFSILQSN